MFNQPLQQPVNVTPGAIATLTIPTGGAQTLVGVKLRLSGTTFDKTKVDKIKVKIGPRLIWDLTMDQLNKINNYKGNGDNAAYIYLDFTERDQPIFPIKEIGGIDLIAALPIGNVIVEVTINGAAVAPKIDAIGYFEPSQANPFVLKYLNYPASSAVAGKFTLPLSFRGALLKRTFHFYTGTNFTATTDGNINRMEVKKNGAVVFDQTCRDARFDQVQLKKTPQANTFVVDYIIDNNHDAQMTTISKTAGGAQVFDTFEANAFLTAADSIQTVVEAIDVINNL
ncbi:major capsid protein P2 [Herbaspirillum robiniae]|uniref:major capsid protein P2 n=1 Tax=Herbaspirillum robiniae TaxID=2014887 RepID=UPI0009A19A32|nr:major capsid protein P2 [Herbaspirillum robiniae]